ncbi:MAG: SDR family oxidoreductase [Syntrophobacteraceae bacterium]|nr:SDR family oxidoreductase [Syntrophobacteraceae bacterium]
MKVRVVVVDSDVISLNGIFAGAILHRLQIMRARRGLGLAGGRVESAGRLKDMDKLPFENRTALITGSSRGIGRSIALSFARHGADIVVNHHRQGGSSEAGAKQLCDEVRALGRRAFVVRADISVKDSVKGLFEETKREFDRLDFLILNAARAPFKPIERLLERELRQLVETNYLGNIFCIQAALPLLEKTQGKIVFISSLGSRFYNPAYPLGSMKAAMESVVRDTAESLGGRGISVNGVCAGIVKTDSFKVLRQYMEEIDRMPEGLFVEPEEVADVVMFLCSPAGRGIRGQTLVVDRGLSNSLYRSVAVK